MTFENEPMSKYNVYENLLYKRDRVNKEAENYNLEYARVFGDLLRDLFSLKIACIEKKKMISYCQRALNKGEKPDIMSIQIMISAEMEDYYNQLQYITDITEISKNGKTISVLDSKEVKTIYRRIAKKIHPDLHPEFEDNDEIRDLWEKAVACYNFNDLEGIQEVEFLIGALLEKLGIETGDIDIKDIDEKIDRLTEEIKKIQSEIPYQYKYTLEDADAVEDKKTELLDETEEYRNYEKELDEILSTFNITEVLS